MKLLFLLNRERLQIILHCHKAVFFFVLRPENKKGMLSLIVYMIYVQLAKK